MEDLPDVDYVNVCLEEVALEGLDGITLDALWIRLQNRPNFCMALDEPAKEYMWEICALHPEIEIFELPTPRSQLVIYNRFAHVDAETGLIIEPDETVQDIYPFEAIKDPNVFGSCATYYTRKPLTDSIRQEGGVLLMGLEEAVFRYGEKLVLVATTHARHRVLLGPEADPQLQLVPLQYMMLERIGRSRYLGEVTQGNASLSSLHQCAKTMFYHRKRLIKNSLITKQLHYQRSKPGFIRNGMLLHLTRFYVERKPKIFVFLQEVCRFLQSKPNRSDTIDAVREYMGVKNTIIRKTFKKFMSKLIETKRVPVLEVDPDAPAKDCYFNNGKEKLVSVLRLMDKVTPDNLEKILGEEEEGTQRRKTGDGDEEGEEADDDDDDDEDEAAAGINPNLKRRGKLQFAIPDQSYQLIDRPLLNQAYDVFRQCGPQGESLRRVGALLGVPRLESRALCRNLTRSGAITPFMKDSGRQRITNYVAKCYAKTSPSCLELIQDCQNLLNFSKGDSRTTTDDSTAGQSDKKPVLESQATSSAHTLQQVSADNPSGEAAETEQKPATFMEGVKKISAMDKLMDGYAVTPRMVKRMILIVQAVQECRVVDSYVKLMKLITKEETKEGYFCRIDRRSVLRIIHILSKEGFIRSIKTILKHGDKEQKVHLICDPSVKNDDSLVINSLEQAKFRHFCVGKDTPTNLPKDENIDSIHSSILELRNLYGPTSQVEKTPMLQNSAAKRHGMLYGFESKFRRMKTIHHFLFYLAYDYGGEMDCVVPEEVAALQVEERFDLPKVYHTDKSWKMFVAPLPQHTGWKRGWCLFSDVILRMPLCIFLRLYNVNYVVEGLSEILDHPIKKNFPLSHLPHAIRSGLLITRKYIFSLHEILTRLVYMGLLSFSQRAMKDKDQIFIFVHRHARVVDTTTSAPGYHLVSDDVDYAVRNYRLETIDELLLYWADLESVCLHTPLGFYTVVQGKRFTFEVMYKKPQLIAALASKTDEDIADDGFIPGDGRGAGGLDSAFFAHLKRNWNWVNLITNMKKTKESALGPKAKHSRVLSTTKHDSAKGQKKDSESSVFISFLRKEGSQIKFPVNAKERLTRLAIGKQLDRQLGKDASKRKPSSASNDDGKKKKKGSKAKAASQPPDKVQNKTTVEKVTKKKATTSRVVFRKQTKIRKPYYDDTDRIALKLVRRRRVAWSSKEDSMLLLCKVASNILRPDHQFLYVPFTVIRDFLHKHLQVSTDKTSRACQRRLHYMLQCEQTVYNVSVFVGEANQDQELLDICKNLEERKDEPNSRMIKFEEVMLKLLDKVKASMSPNQAVTYDLPNSLESFKREFSVTRAEDFVERNMCFTDVKNIVDIHFNVVCTLIMSSLMTKDGRHWSYLLYQLYQQYPEILLTSAMNRLRTTHMVCKRKNIGKLASYKSLLFTLPYQLSNKYDFLLMSRFRVHIYNESIELMDLLQKDYMCGGTGVPIIPESDFGGYAATIVSLAATKKIIYDMSIPDQVVVMQAKPADQSNVLNIKDMDRLVCRKQTANESTWNYVGLPGTSGGATSESGRPTPAKKMRLDSTSSAPSAEDDLESKEHDKSSVVPTIDDKSGSTPVTTSKVRFETGSSHSSRVALYVMRKQMTEAQLGNIQHAHDYLAVNVCPVSCRLVQTPSSLTDNGAVLKEILDQESKFISSQPILVETVDTSYRSLGHNDDVIQEMHSIYEHVCRKRELGALARDLNAWFYGDRSASNTSRVRCRQTRPLLALREHLKLMTADQLVISVGIVSLHYVAHSFAKPWLVHSYELAPFPPSTSTDTKSALAGASGGTSQGGADNAFADALSSTKDSTSMGESGSSVTRNKDDVGDKSSEASVLTAAMIAPRVQTRSRTRKKLFRMKGVVPINPIAGKQTQLHFVCPPWRKPDGAVNVGALESLLRAINGYIMGCPGVSQQQLFNKYGPALTPVQMLRLLEMLEKAKCITRTTVKHSHKASLFGPRVNICEDTDSTNEKLEETENSAMIFYSPEVECCIKLGQMFVNKPMAEPIVEQQ